LLCWSRLFPHFAGLLVERVLVRTESIHVQVRRTTRTARCPTCGRRSDRVHSRYIRRVADEPVGGRPVEIHLEIRRFRCGIPICPRRTFAEQVPHLVERRARRTVPLLRLLQDIGLTIGGRPGARFAERRTIDVSRMTLIRLVRALPAPPRSCPEVLGIDDFALRRHHRYGTVLVDVAASRIIDLLPDRTAASVSTWLGQRQSPRLICRDRAGEYANGARAGAPGAVQVADRFHLACNTSDALERVLHRHAAALRACVQDDGQQAASPVEQVPLRLSPSVGPSQAKRARRLARYETVMRLHAGGLSITTIAAEVGLSRMTVRTYVRADSFPEWPSRRTRLSAGTVHGEYLHRRWAEGVQDALTLWRELQQRGYRGSLRSVQRAVVPWRTGPTLRGRHTRRLGRKPQALSWDHRPPSAAQAVWLLLLPLDRLTIEQQLMRRRLLEAAPEIRQALHETLAFRRLLHERNSTGLEPWLRTAEGSTVPEIRSFASSIRRDQAAVQAALDYEWSSGRVEGQITKIKLVKRQMFGRGSIDLLKQRVMRVG
jgi:transposase